MASTCSGRSGEARYPLMPCKRSSRVLAKWRGLASSVTLTCCGMRVASFLAEEGTDTRLIQDYLGHRDIKSTVIYTETSQRRLSGVRVR
jgi:integrase